MKTLTVKINERTKIGKAFIAMFDSFKGVDGIEIIETDSKKAKKKDDVYNPEFVKMVLDSAKRGDYTEVDPKDVWGSLGLK
ncbi:hypothetical protein Q1W71_13015 [Flavobacterium pectinovorum]|uniref:DUF2683 family protein n=1 Tax=Flavobacterium pectinovorum TaxID=29533 RepID=UPI00265EEF27|nr:DUF2683 family protein [Flavobacterium pectinovorum]WKL45879.1 hypothetical protein Q1W71_13015 [Flavobacterium pectinovorum]